MNKIEHLTPEQEALIPVIRDKWINFALGNDETNDELNRESFTNGVQWLYSLASLSSPFVLVVDSPLAAQYAATYYKAIQQNKFVKIAKKGDQVGAQVGAQVRDRVRAQVRAQVSDQVGAQVGAQVWAQVGAQVRDRVRDRVRAQVWAQVSDQVGDQVRAQVWAQVSDQVSDQVGDQVRAQVRDQVRAQVRAQVRDQVRAQVSDQVGDQVRDQVRDQVGDQKYLWFSYENNAFYSDWAAWFDFYKVIGLVNGKEKVQLERYLEYLKSGVFMTIFLEGLAIGCRRPITVFKNAEGQIHSDAAAALSWRDGYGIYALNGVRFPKELFEKVISGSMPFAEILAIEDIDQRTQAMRFGDVTEFMRHSKGTLLDTREKFRPDKGIVTYQLYKVPKGDIFTEDAYYMVYDDPSTNKKYMSGVNPFTTVSEAMGWKFGISPTDWEELIPLVTES